jgi:predicted alpha/beta superfamily hydrolase
MERTIIKEFKIKNLDNRLKKVRVFLPLDYNESERSYPVLYMHDGQNLNDKSKYSGNSWEIFKNMDESFPTNNGFIVVGMDCDQTRRLMEYSPVFNKGVIKYLEKDPNIDNNDIRPEADQYGEFIINQVKPYVDKNFRTLSLKEHTFIAGSSCGGVISLYLGLKYNDVFSVIGAFSTAFGVVGPKFYEILDKFDYKPDTKIYYDMGTKESKPLGFLGSLAHLKFQHFISKKLPKSNLFGVLEKGGTHTEEAWARRMKQFIEFCFS